MFCLLVRRESKLGNPSTGKINHAPRSISLCKIIVLATATEDKVLKFDIDHGACMVEIKSDARKSNNIGKSIGIDRQMKFLIQ